VVECNVFCKVEGLGSTPTASTKKRNYPPQSNGDLPPPNFENLKNRESKTMNHVCAQCKKKLSDNDEITRIIDEYLYFFCCYGCRFNWVIRHFRR
jgi:hypothetical protein